MKKIISFLWTHRLQMGRYLVVGGSGFVVDIGILYLFKQFFGTSATFGVVCSQAVVVVYNFLLNKYWSFQSRHNTKKQFIKYLFLVFLNYGTGVVAMYVFHDVFSYNYLYVRIATVAFFVPINFLLYKYWVYKNEGAEIL